MGWLRSLFTTRTPAIPFAGMTKAQRYAAVRSARRTQDLDAMWAAWEERGQSRQGLLYAAVLERKQQLGALLSREEKQVLAVAARRRALGASLPPVTGQVKGR